MKMPTRNTYLLMVLLLNVLGVTYGQVGVIKGDTLIQESVSDTIGGSVDWEGLPYQDGEELVYKVYYNLGFIWIAAGEVTFNVKEEAEHLAYYITGRSYASYDRIFKVRDYYHSEVSKSDLLPYNFKRDILEGDYVRFDSIAFNQDSFKLVEYFGKDRGKAKRFEFEVTTAVHDMVSVIYHLRSIDVDTLKEDDRLPVKIFFDKELFELDVVYRGMENKRIKGQGKKIVHHLQPELVQGYVFSEGDLMDIWVSNDDLRVPLMIESPINIGSVKAVLTSVKKNYDMNIEKL